MPTLNNENQDTISILINGRAHSTWTEYRIDSDFLIPADAWRVSMGIPSGIFPPDVKKGAPVLVKIGDETVMVGRIDNVQRTVSRQKYTLALSGRDSAGTLVDCAAPIFTAKKLGLEEVIAQIVRPLGIKFIRIAAEKRNGYDKISIEPGERAWEALMKVANAAGLHPWFEPDGTLVIGGADYNILPVSSLIMRRDGKGNNLLALDEIDAINNCYSELTVLAQGHAQGINSPLGVVGIGVFSASSAIENEDDFITSNAEIGNHNIKAVVADSGVPYYRPHIVVIGDTDNLEQARYRARKLMSDAKLEGYGLIAQVKGHRTSDGVLWQPGQRIHVKSEPHSLDAIFFLIGREFNNSRLNGKTTTLRLKEDGIWIPNAYPKKKKGHTRRGKPELGIVNVG